MGSPQTLNIRMDSRLALFNQCLSWILLVVAAILIGAPNLISSFVILFPDEPMIVSQSLYSGSCVDGENWQSTTGACDRLECHVEASGTYVVTHSCRPREPSENPDTDNCVWEGDSAQAFPDCCPQLQCSAASPLTTVDPTICRDIAQNFACEIWKNLTSGCSDPSSDVYTITQVYCNNTCGLC